MIITDIAREVAQGLRAGRRIDRGVRILTYHGVIERRADPRVERSFHLLADFRAHISILRRCHVLSLEELASGLPRRSLVPRIVVTFDDGFRNNVLAAELLHEARLPTTIFIASDAVARSQTIWPTLLRLVLARGSARVVRLAGHEYDLDRDPTAFGAVRTLFKQRPTPQRRTLWTELVGQLASGELETLVTAFPSIAMMTWTDVRALQAAGVSIGSHGFDHEVHLAEQSADLRRAELADSKSQIEAATGRSCPWFAFPNGTFNPSSSDEVRASGYELGFTMISRAARVADDPMLLPRIMPGPGPEKLATAIAFGN